ncbi:MAG: TIGR00341 family protein [Fimbriimonadaceae bacterium]
MFAFETWLNPIKLSSDRILEVRRDVEDMSTPVRSYFVLVVLSTAIASYGLLAGSTAVVIGAMLVAPLMGPIFGVALGLITGSRRLLFRSGFSESIGVFLVVLISLLIAKFGPGVELGPEILSRTRPTILDLAIALASGLVGAFALANERTNAALPGVAISTALVPPLAACGICLGFGQWALAGGAFVLFLANFLAIELAAALVFTIYGMRRERASSGFGAFVRQFGLSGVLLLVMSFFLYRALASTIEQSRLHSKVGGVLATLATEIPGARLDTYSIEKRPRGTDVAAVFLTPSAFGSDSVSAIEGRLRAEVSEDIRLVVRSLISSDSDSRGPVYVPEERREKQAAAERRAEYFASLRRTIDDYLDTLPGAELANLFIPAELPETNVTAVVNTPMALAPEQVAALQNLLRKATGREVSLTVRSLLTIDANFEKYIYTAAKPPEPTAEERRMIERLRAAFKNQLSRRQPGAFLVNLTVTEEEGRWKVRGICRSPAAITPEMVKEIEDDVQEYIAPNIDLVVRTLLEADASSSRYLIAEDE